MLRIQCRLNGYVHTWCTHPQCDRHPTYDVAIYTSELRFHAFRHCRFLSVTDVAMTMALTVANTKFVCFFHFSSAVQTCIYWCVYVRYTNLSLVLYSQYSVFCGGCAQAVATVLPCVESTIMCPFFY